jgi:hypothetical protein
MRQFYGARWPAAIAWAVQTSVLGVPLEGGSLPTKMFRLCGFLTVHAGTVSSTQESYLADGNNESSLDELIRILEKV